MESSYNEESTLLNSVLMLMPANCLYVITTGPDNLVQTITEASIRGSQLSRVLSTSKAISRPVNYTAKSLLASLSSAS